MNNFSFNKISNILSFLIVLTTLAGLCSLFYVVLFIKLPHVQDSMEGNYLRLVIRFFSFYTAWINITALLIFARILMMPDKTKQTIITPYAIMFVTASLSFIGFEFFMLLGIRNHTGLYGFSDVSLHYISPVLVILYWIGYQLNSKKLSLKTYFAKWYIYLPVLYLVYYIFAIEVLHLQIYPFASTFSQTLEMGLITVPVSFFFFLFYFYVGRIIHRLVDIR
ncbi:MAG: hypothetical protein QM528_07585 [Phycisphaerales bacterium]|nr:hypothetical protein [Phycisphaerales bacterium]